MNVKAKTAMNQKNEKAERLAAALRDNLKRRKAQARAADAPPPDDDPIKR